jgi:hypothetical protein
MIYGFGGFQRVLILRNYGISEPPVVGNSSYVRTCDFIHFVLHSLDDDS